MKYVPQLFVAGLMLALATPVLAASADSPFHVNNRLRLGYDDNVYQVGDPSGSALGKKSSFRVVEEIESLLIRTLNKLPEEVAAEFLEAYKVILEK